MKGYKIKCSILSMLWLLLSLSHQLNATNIGKPPSVLEITRAFFEKTESIKSLKYELNKRERIGGQLVNQQSEVKLKKEPFQIYIKQLAPKNGVEVLFNENQNSNKALVNPSGFPWMNLSLDPFGNWMRDNQHHTIYDSGFDLMVSILKHLYEKYEDDVKTMITYQGTDSRKGTECHVISCNNPFFKHINYEVKKGDDLLTIARERKISEHMILELNKNIEGYYDIVPGQEIIIPNDYSPKMLIYLSKATSTPILVQVFDHEGLYEEYEYSSIEVNPEINPKEFSQEFEDYGF